MIRLYHILQYFSFFMVFLANFAFLFLHRNFISIFASSWGAGVGGGGKLCVFVEITLNSLNNLSRIEIFMMLSPYPRIRYIFHWFRPAFLTFRSVSEFCT